MDALAVGEHAKLAEGTYLEGLAYDFGRDVVWYSDVIKGGIHGVRRDGTPVTSFNRERMYTGGIMLNADGAVLSSGPGGIMWNHPDTGKSGWLLREIDGQALNGVNEMWPDGAGGIFFGTIDIEHIAKAQPTRPCGLYRLTGDRRVRRVADVHFPNGMAADRQRGKFYCSDTFQVGWAWDMSAEGALSNQRVLLQREDCDGMALDAEGNVWVTGFRSPGIIRRLTPEGEALTPVTTPAGSTTQIRFGGADLRDYYITVVPADGGDSLKNGEPLKGASALYRGRSQVAGVQVSPANFDLS